MGEPGREERSARKRRRSVDRGADGSRCARATLPARRDITRSLGCSPFSKSLSLATLLSSPSPLPFLSVPFTHTSPQAITTLASSVNFLDGVMGYASGRCMLDYIRIVVEFISQHEYNLPARVQGPDTDVWHRE
jgi:hypothetical protein